MKDTMRQHIGKCPNCRESFELLISNLTLHGYKLIVAEDFLTDGEKI